MTFPILLIPGLARFDIFWHTLLNTDETTFPPFDRLHYFRGIRTLLMRNGIPTYCASLPWAGGVDRRAEALKHTVIRLLRETGASKINLIGHSMGGLDARHMLFNDRSVDRIHRRIASLTTVSTPHEGSPFADRVVNAWRPLFRLSRATSLDFRGFMDVTTSACKAYNAREDVQAFERACEREILFQTYAGRQPCSLASWLHRSSCTLIYRMEGDNDGMVSVRSAKWRDRYFRGILEGMEHFNEIGWFTLGQMLRPSRFKKQWQAVRQFYLDLAGSLP